jgi:flagellar protein FlaG
VYAQEEMIMTINVKTSPDVSATVVSRLPSSGESPAVVQNENVVSIRRVDPPVANNAQADTATENVAAFKPTSQQLQKQIEELNDSKIVRRNLQFTVDDVTGISVITVRDAQSDEVIRQIPSEELLQLARRVKEMTDDQDDIKGVLLHTRA